MNKDLDLDMIMNGIELTHEINEEDIPDINMDGGEYVKEIIRGTLRNH